MRIRKYLSICKTNFLGRIAYPTGFILHALFIGIILFIFVNMWMAVYSSSGSNVIEGFTLVMMVWYLVMTESIITSHGDVITEVNEDIQSGEIAYKLNKPYDYIMYFFSNNIAYRIISFVMTFTLAGIIVYLMAGGINMSLLSIPIIAISVFLALTLDFFFTMIIALLGFWVEESKPFYWVYTKIVFTIGGMLMPLEFFPSWLRGISKVLPFSYITYHPAKLFVNFSLDYAFSVLSIQILYIVLLMIICYMVYRIGSRRVDINGG